MASFIIQGGMPLSGELRVHGAKNAALPILAASLLAPGNQNIHEVPNLLDIRVMLDILTALGVKTKQDGHSVSLDTSSLTSTSIPEHLMGKMRSSIFLMGPILARFGSVTVSRPGGCAIGERPIDLHLQGLKALGAEIAEKHGTIYCKAKELIGTDFYLRYPSVGATENLMMAATLAKGKTKLYNAAKEPEIVDLQNFLNKMGARVLGAGSDCITIEGVDVLHPIDYHVIPDRILTGTLLLAAAITRGEIALSNVVPEHSMALLHTLKASGVEITTYRDIMTLKAQGAHVAVDCVETSPYPGFPTDLQALIMAYLATVKGTSIIKEKVFEGRYKHVNELNRMGSNITTDHNVAFIRGVERLSGAEVEATDLRAGAALVIAGLSAEGQTKINAIHHIDRGYENLEYLLKEVGAQIKRVTTDTN